MDDESKERAAFHELFLLGYSINALASLLGTGDFGNANDHGECVLEIESFIRGAFNDRREQQKRRRS